MVGSGKRRHITPVRLVSLMCNIIDRNPSKVHVFGISMVRASLRNIIKKRQTERTSVGAITMEMYFCVSTEASVSVCVSAGVCVRVLLFVCVSVYMYTCVCVCVCVCL